MVEEFMLLANVSVAEKILEEFPEVALLRRHPEPPIQNFDPLIKAASYQVKFILLRFYFAISLLYKFELSVLPFYLCSLIFPVNNPWASLVFRPHLAVTLSGVTLTEASS